MHALLREPQRNADNIRYAMPGKEVPEQTPSRKMNSNIDCAFFEKALVSVVPKNGRACPVDQSL